MVHHEKTTKSCWLVPRGHQNTSSHYKPATTRNGPENEKRVLAETRGEKQSAQSEQTKTDRQMTLDLPLLVFMETQDSKTPILVNENREENDNGYSLPCSSHQNRNMNKLAPTTTRNSPTISSWLLSFSYIEIGVIQSMIMRYKTANQEI